MGKINEGIKTFNTTVRTVLMAGAVGVVGTAGYLGYNEYTENERNAQLLEMQTQELTDLKGQLATQSAEVEKLNEEVSEKLEQIERLETSMALLKTDQRLARLDVVDIKRDEDGKALTSTLEFVELSPTGETMSQAKKIVLPGDLVYVDNWVVKFDDKYIEKGDVERGTSLCLFRRIFSEQQFPSQGVSLDEVGMRPQAYARGGAVSEFERKLWSEFWEFANDPAKAAEMGIRAANGEAISIKVKEGKSYNIELRASGGLSIQPVDKATDADNDSKS